MRTTFLLVAAMAVVSFSSFGCGTPTPTGCSAETCATGCCDATGMCRAGSSSSECGKGGAMCNSCSFGQSCVANACVTSSTGGGSAAGGSAAGGSAAGGSAAGGSAAGGDAGGSAAGGDAGGSAAGGDAGGSAGGSAAGGSAGGSAAGGSAAGGSAAGGSAGGSTAGGSAAGGSAAGGSAAGGSADMTPPTILSTTPPAGATGVARSSGDGGITITIDFSEPIDTASFMATLTPMVSLLGAPSFSNGNASASITTATSLNANATYTVSVAARDLANNALAPPSMFGFTTAAAADNTPPTVTSTVPTNNAMNVATAGLAISATFSEAVTPASVVATINAPFELGTPTLNAGNTVATWSMPIFDDGGVATYQPATNYAVTVEASDVAGNSMTAPYPFSFTTAAPADMVAPTLVSILPADTTTNVALNTVIVMTFSEPMNTATVQSGLRINGATRAGTFGWNATNSVVRFTPTANWSASTPYTVAFSAPPTDVAGNPLGSVSVSFTTGTAIDAIAATIVNRSPATNATGVPTQTGCDFLRQVNVVTLTYNSAVDPVSFAAAFRVLQGTTPVAGTIRFNPTGTVVTFAPSVRFNFGTTYTVEVNNGGNIALDLQRNPIANLSYSFSTLLEYNRVIYATPTASGRILSGAVLGQSTVATNVAIRVGEFNAATRSRGFLSFPLAAIPSNTYCLTSASLVLEQTGVNGTPYGTASLGNVLSEAVNMGDTVSGADYATPAITGNFINPNLATLVTEPSLGFKTALITGQVRLARAQAVPANVRWRLRFTNDAMTVGGIDNASFQNIAFSGRLVVRYEAP